MTHKPIRLSFYEGMLYTGMDRSQYSLFLQRHKHHSLRTPVLLSTLDRWMHNDSNVNA